MDTLPADDGDSPPLDDEADAAMTEERRERREPVAKSPEPTNDAPLPEVDALMTQIPAEAREVLDELFRARFTTVRRIPAEALKMPGA